MSVRSMTGFAHARGNTADGEIAFSLKSVNHRGLDLHFHLAPELDRYENAFRTAVKRHVVRGHLQIHADLVKAQGAAMPAYNRPLLEAYLTAFNQIAERHDLNCKPDLNAALRLPGMFASAPEDEPGEEREAAVVAILEQGLETLNGFREREGAEIVAEMRDRSAAILRLAAEMEGIRTHALPVFQARLSEKLAELLKGAGLEPQRLAQEAAFLADRSDVSEELARLANHTCQLQKLLDAGGEIGKKLDFLLQEMGRETNTMLSKTSGVGEFGLSLTDRGLAVKAEIEKIREQSLNIE
jgi:uncharacterized protein (TIGR00255 family)